MTTTTFDLRSPRQPVTILSLMDWCRTTFEVWSARARQRRDLSELSPELLSDIGLTADAARAEAEKPFWRA